ncbi:MAG: branched-chain amino acid ABC transporter permease [Actinobacteria bacterium]|jgi:branched-chain amino acid transport system permease protein|nr:branched-chain amino acid ABC transporter permease [Actinomycetota bacterium]
MDLGFVFGQSITQAIGVTAIIYCLAAMGVNMQFGYTGLLNFGQVAFVAVGAYSVGVIVVTLGLTLWLAIPISIFASVVLALVLGIPTLRLRADYLAIVTIAASEIVRQLVRSIALRDVLGGANGINGKMGQEFHDLNPFPADFELPFLTYTRQDLWVVIVGWALIAVLTLLIWLLVRSPWGRVIKGIREDENAVVSLGKNTYVYKMQALILGGLLGTLGGVIWAVAKQSVQPDNFVPDVTFFAYTIVLLGGAARVFGPIIGAIIFWFLLVFVGEFLNQAIQAGWLDFLEPTDIGPIRFILVGIGLMSLMIFRPQGIFGDKKELALDGR